MREDERAELIRQYEDGVPAFKRALAAVPAAALKWRPAAGAWSVHEIVCHCADSETNSASRLRYLTGEHDLSLDNYDQDRWAVEFDYHAHPLDAALATVEAVRANTAPLLRRLSPERWQRVHQHKTYGRYTAENWLRTYAVHLHEHARQIEDNVAAWRAQPARATA
jgi:DinB family protein